MSINGWKAVVYSILLCLFLYVLAIATFLSAVS